MTEEKQPTFTKILESVNAVVPETIIQTEYVWKDKRVLRFSMPLDILEELVEEFGSKLKVFL